MGADRCPECGRPLPPGASCREGLHALLFIEDAIPGGPGHRAHFLAVASFGLQHPESMGYTVEALEALRSAVAGVLEGTATIDDARRRARSVAAKSRRVSRRGGEAVPLWRVANWPITVDDVTTGGPDGYLERVERWAESIIAVTAELHP